ncbi:MAG: leucine--tRNA ligase [Clostridia bacterium]
MESIIYSKEIDEKWQKKWQVSKLYQFDESKIDNKLYLLEMFSYPSGKNLHIGHWWNYGLTDSYGRLKRMQGYQVFHPPGFDAFGLPAENYAIKTGIHPDISTKNNIATMEEQFCMMGTTYDWNYEVVTCNPEYYKWTQWLFLKLLEKGLAYRKEAPVNWCPSCMTVLANEQVIDNKCERCETDVVRRNMTQWFFKITDYSDELLTGLKKLDWPEKTKKIQENWIGKSHGAEIDFKTADDNIKVFTTRADTVMGVTYIVIAPEHPLTDKLTTPEHKTAVEAYREFAAKQSEIERMSTVKEKTGVFTGAYAVHPITKKHIPVWVSDYVLIGYGTGAVMAVPAHDERDFEFASKYHLPIITVVNSAKTDSCILPFCEDGILVNSNKYDGMPSEDARIKISADLEKAQRGKATVKYRLRDWLVSRQRYWGAPIPIIYCDDCGIVPVPESELPVKLPYNVEFLPNGKSPLAACPEFVNTICPICGKPAKRETDTLDTFVCSSWYYLRFFDNKNSAEAFSKEKVNRIMSVDKYVGGIEHASMHLLYARFITKALRDMGYLNFDEPFTSLVHQGVILGSDGQKMSKRNGAVSPDVYINQYGSDVFRLYLGFGFSYRDGGPWNDEGIKSMARFVAKVSRVVENFLNFKEGLSDTPLHPDSDLEYIRNFTIQQVTNDINDFEFNTATARIMEFVNGITKYQTSNKRSAQYEESLVRDLILFLAPMAPHYTEELWENMGYDYSVHDQPFPVCDDSKLIKDMNQIAVQVNGTLRDVISVSCSIDDESLKIKAISTAKVKAIIGERHIKNIIMVRGRLVNIVC